MCPTPTKVCKCTRGKLVIEFGIVLFLVQLRGKLTIYALNEVGEFLQSVNIWDLF